VTARRAPGCKSAPQWKGQSASSCLTEPLRHPGAAFENRECAQKGSRLAVTQHDPPSRKSFPPRHQARRAPWEQSAPQWKGQSASSSLTEPLRHPGAAFESRECPQKGARLAVTQHDPPSRNSFPPRHPTGSRAFTKVAPGARPSVRTPDTHPPGRAGSPCRVASWPGGGARTRGLERGSIPTPNDRDHVTPRPRRLLQASWPHSAPYNIHTMHTHRRTPVQKPFRNNTTFIIAASPF
jgi:hypothetical protein